MHVSSSIYPCSWLTKFWEWFYYRRGSERLCRVFQHNSSFKSYGNLIIWMFGQIIRRYWCRTRARLGSIQWWNSLKGWSSLKEIDARSSRRNLNRIGSGNAILTIKLNLLVAVTEPWVAGVPLQTGTPKSSSCVILKLQWKPNSWFIICFYVMWDLMLFCQAYIGASLTLMLCSLVQEIKYEKLFFFN